jgi:2-oxo-3-hexenedioate decarboxylase
VTDIDAIARRLDDAARKGVEIPQLEEPLTLADAYAVQKQSMAYRYGRGERQVGIKMGLTSRAKMAQMGLRDMVWGRLTDRMIVEDGGSIGLSRYVHPRVEPEVAYLLRRELAGIVTPLQALAAVEAVAPAIEIIDSRYRAFKFSLTDVVADNSSSSGFVIGPWNAPDCDVSNLGIVASFNGAAVLVGSTAAVLGHPLRSLVAAARFAAEADEPLQPGWIVLAGGATPAEALKPNLWVACEVQRLGRCGFAVAE